MKIRKIVFGIVSALAAMSTPALAADLPAKHYKAPPMVAPVAYSWTGCYVGVEGGGAFGSSKHIGAGRMFPASNGAPITNNFGVNGGEVGGTVGCNYQVSSFVFGIENDFSDTFMTGSAPDLAPFDTTAVSHTSQQWLDTLRGRVGFAWDRALFYGTGGAAFTSTTASICFPGLGSCFAESKTRTGWAAGAGVEYAMWDNVSLKFEYLHADFGSARYLNFPQSMGFSTFGRDVKLSDDIVRVGVNWRFTSLPGMTFPGQ